MKSALISSILVAVAMFAASCCSQQRVQPTRPEKVRGWNESKNGDVVSVGAFVLKKGESTDNGELGVRVEEIIAPTPCAEGYAGTPRVVLKFYRPSDNKVFCDHAEFGEGGTSIGNGPPYPHCTPEVGLSAISVNSINTQENWVSFDLRK
jgi:hypothetical protein